MDTQEKTRIVQKRILRELALYGSQHKGEGLAMSMLAAKYARATEELGGFPEFMEAMRLCGLIDVAYSESGARTVSVAAIDSRPAAPKIEWF